MFKRLMYFIGLLFLLVFFLTASDNIGWMDVRRDWPEETPDPNHIEDTNEDAPTPLPVWKPTKPEVLSITLPIAPPDDELTMYIESRFGVQFSRVPLDFSDWQLRVETWEESGSMPDMFIYPIKEGSLNNYRQWVASGTLRAIELDKYPNLKNMTRSHTLSDVLTIDDKQYGMPISSMPSEARGVPFTGILYRRDWAQTVGLYREDDTYTLAEYRQLLTAFLQSDPNQSGTRNTLALVSEDRDVVEALTLRPAGLHLKGNASDIAFTGGQTLWIPQLPEYRNLVQECLSMCDAGLLWPEYARNHNRGRSAFTNGEAGAYWMTGENGFSQYDEIIQSMLDRGAIRSPEDVGILLVKGETGRLRFSQQNGYNSMLLVKSDANEAGVNQGFTFWDWLASDEGQRFRQFGIEGKDYILNGDGEVELLWKVKNGVPISPYEDDHSEMSPAGYVTPSEPLSKYAASQSRSLWEKTGNPAILRTWNPRLELDVSTTFDGFQELLESKADALKADLLALMINESKLSVEKRMEQFDTLVAKHVKGLSKLLDTCAGK